MHEYIYTYKHEFLLHIIIIFSFFIYSVRYTYNVTVFYRRISPQSIRLSTVSSYASDT